MEIGPIKPSGFSVTESTNRRSQKGQADEPDHGPDTPARSAEACTRKCRETGIAEGTEQTEQDRLSLIRQRIEAGYYDQIGVKEKMIDRMIDEMLKNISEFYK